MIYKMSRKMFHELSVAIGSKEYPAKKSSVIEYINQTFGLRGTVEDVTLV